MANDFKWQVGDCGCGCAVDCLTCATCLLADSVPLGEISEVVEEYTVQKTCTLLYAYIKLSTEHYVLVKPDSIEGGGDVAQTLVWISSGLYSSYSQGAFGYGVANYANGETLPEGLPDDGRGYGLAACYKAAQNKTYYSFFDNNFFSKMITDETWSGDYFDRESEYKTKTYSPSLDAEIESISIDDIYKRVYIGQCMRYEISFGVSTDFDWSFVLQAPRYISPTSALILDLGYAQDELPTTDRELVEWWYKRPSTPSVVINKFSVPFVCTEKLKFTVYWSSTGKFTKKFKQLYEIEPKVALANIEFDNDDVETVEDAQSAVIGYGFQGTAACANNRIEFSFPEITGTYTAYVAFENTSDSKIEEVTDAEYNSVKNNKPDDAVLKSGNSNATFAEALRDLKNEYSLENWFRAKVSPVLDGLVLTETSELKRLTQYVRFVNDAFERCE